MTDTDRMTRLYEMAARCRSGDANYILRDAALDGIESEIAKQGQAIDWLRATLHPDDVMSFACAEWWVVMVRDRRTGGFRGSSGATENDAAASTIARHLPYTGMMLG